MILSGEIDFDYIQLETIGERWGIMGNTFLLEPIKYKENYLYRTLYVLMISATEKKCQVLPRNTSFMLLQ